MSIGNLSIALGSDPLVLERGELRVEIVRQPFSMTIRRRGRRLLRAVGAWVAEGTIHDHFIQFTEGVVAREELAPPERARRAVVLAALDTGIELGLVLDGGRGQGPRAASLMPDVLVCVVEASAIVASVPEAVAAMHRSVLAAGRPLTLISGPSATSDIELERVEGVHGPRRLEVVLAG